MLLNSAIAVFVFFHNVSYRAISSLAVRINGGVHPKHRIIGYHRFFLEHIPANARVLDVGCGDGHLDAAIAKRTSRIVGMDIKADSIKKAQHRHASAKIEYLVGDATTYKFTEKFDAVILSNTLEHIKDRVGFLKKLSKQAPLFLLRVPALTRDWLTVYKKEGGLEYRLDPTHYIEYTEESFRDELEKAGLTIQSLTTQFGEFYAVATVNSFPSQDRHA